MKNPFRTKSIIIAGVKYNTLIKVPFIGPIIVKKIKVELSKSRGYHSDIIIYDEMEK